MRFVALMGTFVLLLAGYTTYVAWFRATPELVGATDAAHVAAVRALIAAVPAPAGATLDPYGTWCDSAAAACWTSTTQQPKALISALTETLVAEGSKVRSHECMKPESRPIQARDGACVAVLDYHGSRVDVTASSAGKSDNGGRTFLRLASPLVNPMQDINRAAALGPWASVDPLPVAWTTGVTCMQPTDDGCRRYGQRADASPVIAVPRAGVCADVRAALRGKFFIAMDEDGPVAGSTHPFCRVVAHRYRSLGGKDGEEVFAVATSTGPTSTTLSFIVSPWM